MDSYKINKAKLYQLTSNGNCYYLQMKIFVYPISTRLVYYTGKIGLHPIYLTILVGLFSVLCLIFYHIQMYSFALMFFWARTVLDYSDGALARYTNKESRVGGYLDGNIDKSFFIALWVLVALQLPTMAFKAYFLTSCFAYLFIIDLFVMPKIGQLKKRAWLKQYFMDRGILIGMGAYLELEFWILVFLALGFEQHYILILLVLNNLDVVYRMFEVRKSNVQLSEND
jgi:archaetidylinositol phosphate synthase